MNRMRTAGAVNALLHVTAAVPVKRDELVGSAGLAEVSRRNKQAGLSRSRGKQLRRAAVAELVQLSHQSIVLGHIHPRWLRAAVEARIVAGETITLDDVEALRRTGPQPAYPLTQTDTCFADGRPCYVAGSEPHFRCGTSACGRTGIG